MECSELSVKALKKLIKKDADIQIFDCLKSTNVTAKLEAEKGAPEGSLIIARSQTGGRGRLGRSFYSPEKSGIYFSLVLRPKFPPEDITFITPLAAVAVCLAIEEVTGKSPKIKWVNDIFINNKKVCGILSEAAFSSATQEAEYVILGIGINLFTPEKGFPEEIKNIAGSLLERGEEIDLKLLLAHTVNNFFELYEVPRSPKAVSAYSDRLMLKNKKVTYFKNGLPKEGTVLDIDESFHLVIKKESGETEHLQSGEVTVGSKEVIKNG